MTGFTIQRGYCPVDAGELYYTVTGGGPALVFIHAGIADQTMWDTQVEHFAPRFRVIRYDTRGFGQTRSQPTSYSNRQDLRALLDHLQVEQAILVGCSRGGQIALDFTLEYPGRVSTLALVGSAPGGFEAAGTDEENAVFEAMEQAERAGDWERVIEMDLRAWIDGFERVGQADANLRERIRSILKHTYSVHTAIEITAIPLEPPAVGRLGEIKVPFLTIVGDLDESYAQTASRYMAQQIAGARQVVMVGTAHLPNMEQPEHFNQILDEFLNHNQGEETK